MREPLVHLETMRAIAAHLVHGDCRAEVREGCSCQAGLLVFLGGREGEIQLCLASYDAGKALSRWADYAGITIDWVAVAKMIREGASR